MLVPNSLFEVAKAFQKSPDILMVSALGWSLLPNGEKELFDKVLNKDDELKLISSFPYFQPSCYFKRKVLDDIGFVDETFEITMDRDLYVRIALKGEIKKLNFPVAIFRIHKYQKTFRFSEVWHQNRLKVFSRLVRTLPYTKIYIPSLKEAGLYLSETYKYSNYKKFNVTEVNQILAQYLTDLANINYLSQRFTQTRIITGWLKKYLPDFCTEETFKLHHRSLLFRVPLVYKGIKKIQKILSHNY